MKHEPHPLTGNKFAKKPDEEKHGDTFSLRAPTGLKGRAVAAARKRGVKLTVWLIGAIEGQIKQDSMEEQKLCNSKSIP